MKEYIAKLPQEIKDLIVLISNVAAKSDMRVYLVGGFVRDMLLGVKNLDLDITVEGDGIKFAEFLSAQLNAKLVSHKRFGTATLTLKHGLKIDIATARLETYPYPGSLPVVTAGSVKDDLLRRDFTINAMAVSINKDSFGQLIDIYAGRRDLNAEIVRILHDVSFVDDPTRMLRAVRFATRYGFKIEPASMALIRQALKNKMLAKVDPQRLRDELMLILKEEYPLKQIYSLKKIVGFDSLHMNNAMPKARKVLLSNIERQIKWFMRNYPQRRKLDAWLIYLIGLLDVMDIGKVKVFCSSFAFRRGEEKRVLSYKKISRKFISELSRAKIKPSRIFALLEPLSYEVILLIKAKYSNKHLQSNISNFFEIYNGMRIYSSGQDLGSLGVKPGPDYKRIFSRVLEAKLNGGIKTKEEEIFLIKQLIRRRSNGQAR